MSRRVDKLALGWAIAFLLLAILLGLAWASDAGAATNPRVNTKRATSLVLRAEKRAWLRSDARARAFGIRCSFDDLRGRRSKRTGVPTRCTFRAYRHRNGTGLLASMTFRVRVVAHRAAGLGPDGDGVVSYTARRSLLLDVVR